MTLKNTIHRYGAVVVTIHWLAAALVLALLGIARLLHFARLFEGDPAWLLALRGAGSKM